MAVLVEMHHTGEPALRAEVVAAIEHVVADRVGNWRVFIVGSRRMTGGGRTLQVPRVLSGRIPWRALPRMTAG
jgi:hypothetical protein